MPILLQLLICFLMAFSISLYIVPVIVRIDRSLQLFDNPNERSSAKIPIPTFGGIAIFFSFVFVSIMGMIGYNMPELIFILTAAMLIFFVGLKDDLVNLSPIKKLIVELIAAGIIIFPAQIRFTNLHGLFGVNEIGMFPSFIITAFAIIVIINAFNLTDGIDGLAASLSVMIAITLGSWFLISGHYEYAILSFALAGAVGGFFYFNVYGIRNKIFMGDTGSLVLGTIISILVIRFNEFNIDQSQPYAIGAVPAISFGILSYPLIDMLRVILIRLLDRKSPFEADKNHLHHRLLTLGFSHKKATYTILSLNIIFVSILFALHHIGILGITAYILIPSTILFMLPTYLIRRKTLIHKNKPVQRHIIPVFTPQTVLSDDGLKH